MEKLPTRIVVQDHLSKNRRPFFSFLGPEGCQYLVAYLEQRLQAGEHLTPESPIITRRRRRSTFIRTLNIGDLLRKPMRQAGLKEPPYIWRSYFSSRCLLAEAKGLPREMREFFMGHSGGVGSIYSLHKQLPPDTIEAMRTAYAKALEFLETQPQAPTNTPVLDMVAVLLQASGYTEEDVAAMRLDTLENDDIVKLLRAGPRAKKAEAPKASPPPQQVVALGDLTGYLQQGWLFQSNLGDGRAVIARPA